MIAEREIPLIEKQKAKLEERILWGLSRFYYPPEKGPLFLATLSFSWIDVYLFCKELVSPSTKITTDSNFARKTLASVGMIWTFFHSGFLALEVAAQAFSIKLDDWSNKSIFLSPLKILKFIFDAANNIYANTVAFLDNLGKALSARLRGEKDESRTALQQAAKNLAPLALPTAIAFGWAYAPVPGPRECMDMLHSLVFDKSHVFLESINISAPRIASTVEWLAILLTMTAVAAISYKISEKVFNPSLTDISPMLEEEERGPYLLTQPRVSPDLDQDAMPEPLSPIRKSSFYGTSSLRPSPSSSRREGNEESLIKGNKVEEKDNGISHVTTLVPSSNLSQDEDTLESYFDGNENQDPSPHQATTYTPPSRTGHTPLSGGVISFGGGGFLPTTDPDIDYQGDQEELPASLTKGESSPSPFTVSRSFK